MFEYRGWVDDADEDGNQQTVGILGVLTMLSGSLVEEVHLASVLPCFRTLRFTC